MSTSEAKPITNKNLFDKPSSKIKIKRENPEEKEKVRQPPLKIISKKKSEAGIDTEN